MAPKKNDASKKTDKNNNVRVNRKNSLKPEIISIITIGICILVIISVFSGNGKNAAAFSDNAIGFLGGIVCWLLKGIFGIGAYVLPFAVICLCSSAFFSDDKKIKLSKFIISIILFLILISFMHLLGGNNEKSAIDCFNEGGALNGGFIGCLIGNFLYGILGFGTYIIFVLLAIILVVMITGKSFMSFLRNAYFKIKNLFEKDDFFEDEEYEDTEFSNKNFSDENFDEKKNRKITPKHSESIKKNYSDRKKQYMGKRVVRKNGKILSVNIPEKRVSQEKMKISLFIDEINKNKNKSKLPSFLSYNKNKKNNIDTAFNNTNETKDVSLDYENYDENIVINGMVADSDNIQENFYENSPDSYNYTENTFETPNNEYGYPSLKDRLSEKELQEKVIENLKERYREKSESSYVFGDIEHTDYNNNEFSQKQSFDNEIFYDENSSSEIFDNEIPNDDFFNNEYIDIENTDVGSFSETNEIHNSPEETDISNYDEHTDTTKEELFPVYENEDFIPDKFIYNEEETDENLRKAMFDYFDGDIGTSIKPEPTFHIEQNNIKPSENKSPLQKTKHSVNTQKENNAFTNPNKNLININKNNISSNTVSVPREINRLDEPKILQAEKQILVNENSAQKEIPKKEYIFPPVSFLEKNPVVPNQSSREEILENSRILVKTLKSFNIEAKVNEISKGPTVTRYELSPGEGIKVSKILGLADNLAMSLAAKSIRIEAPIPGKAAVGIEIPNKEVTSVYLSEVICDKNFQDFPSKLAFGLGKDITGNVIVADIAKMPHMLVAGRTGSGKSVCINTLITSIIYKATPDEVKLIMVDPKVVELSVYNGIPHLLIPVVTDPQKAAGALNWAVSEMMARYDLFAKTGSRNIKGYNSYCVENGIDKIPQIVIIIDELADLMMVASKDVEAAICRLAQLARAAGIHLIIATQRPSVDVITGLIKANIPSRIAFAVSSTTDSRTILDMGGADKLLGMGDMLFKSVSVDSDKPLRIQGAFISDKDVEKIVSFIKENNPAVYDEALIDKITSTTASGDKGGNDDNSDDSDELIDEAINFVVKKGSASGSMLQRKFKIGYNRAARIIEELEERGIVGPETGTSKPRAVLMNRYEYEDYMERRRDYI